MTYQAGIEKALVLDHCGVCPPASAQSVEGGADRLLKLVARLPDGQKSLYLYPDIEVDRALYEALRVGDYDTWRQTPLAALEESGQQEVLNWMCLAGAMAELGRKPNETELVRTYLFNSSKCFAFFKP